MKRSTSSAFLLRKQYKQKECTHCIIIRKPDNASKFRLNTKRFQELVQRIGYFAIPKLEEAAYIACIYFALTRHPNSVMKWFQLWCEVKKTKNATEKVIIFWKEGKYCPYQGHCMHILFWELIALDAFTCRIRPHEWYQPQYTYSNLTKYSPFPLLTYNSRASGGVVDFIPALRSVGMQFDPTCCRKFFCAALDVCAVTRLSYV